MNPPLSSSKLGHYCDRLLFVRLILALAILALSGCSTYYGPPPSFSDLPSSSDDKPKVKFKYPKDEKSKTDKHETNGDVTEKPVKLILSSPESRLLEQAAKAEQNIQDKSIYAFVDAGITYSDVMFDRLFDSFKVRQDKIRYDQNLLNIVFSGAVGILGLTGSDSKALGILGVTQSTLNSDFQNYSAVYLLSPALGQLHDKLVDARRTLAAQLLAKAKNMTFDAARRELSAYHHTGSLLAIQEYLRSSVDVAKFTVTNEAGLAKQSEVERLSLQLRDVLKLDSFDATAALALSLVFNDRANVDKLVAWHKPQDTAATAKASTQHIQQRGLATLASWLKNFTSESGKQALDALSGTPAALQLLGKLDTALDLRSRRTEFDNAVTDIEQALAKPDTPAKAKPTAAISEMSAEITSSRIIVTPK